MAFRLAQGVFAAGLVMLAGLALAEAPARFNYQAKLNDGDGVPLEGAHTLYFTLCHGGTAGSADSGSAVFAENAVVAATDGVVSHAVGTGTNTLGGSLTPAMLDFAGDIYLQVAINTVGNVVLPRTRLDSVPFALSGPFSGAIPSGAILAAEPGTTFTGFTPLEMRSDSLGKWAARADMPTTRGAMSAVEVGGRIYVMGGLSKTSILFVTAVNEAYDPATNTWEAKASLPTARHLHSAAASGGNVHVMGGSIDAASKAGTLNHYVYDPVGDSWDVAANLPAPRSLAAVAAVGNRIHLIGGIDDTLVPKTTNHAYNVPTNDWTTFLAALPSGYVGPSVGTVNGYIMVAGGTDGVIPANSVLRYDHIANSWLRLRSMPVAVGEATAAVLGDNFVVVGGTDSGGFPYPGVNVFDESSGAWIIKASLPTGRGLSACASAGGRVYCFGGISAGSAVLRDTLELNPGVFALHQKD